MNLKKMLSIGLASMISLTMLAGCSGETGSAPGNTPENGASATGSTAATPNDGKTVVYWSMWESTEPQGQAIAQAVESFQKETGIKVDLQFKGRTGNREALQPALDAGQTIDLFDEDIDRVNETYKNYIMDLEELAKKYDYEKTAIPGLMQACRDASFDQKLRTIPYQPNVFAIFYNQKIFEEAGVTAVPATWDELLSACAKIKEAGYTPITCDDAYITSMVGYHLGRLVGEEGVRKIVNDKDWDNPAVRKFAEDYAQLASLGYFSANISSNVWPTGQNVELAGGTAAMYLNGSWLPNEVKATAGEDFKWGCFSYPAVDGGVNGIETSNYGAQVFAINNKSAVADEAFQLIQYLTKGEADKNLSVMSTGIPADTTNSEWPALLSSVKPVMDSLTNRWTWAVGVESNVNATPVIKDATLKLCGGSLTPDQYIETLKTNAG